MEFGKVDHLKRWLVTLSREDQDKEASAKPQDSFSADDVRRLFEGLKRDGFVRTNNRVGQDIEFVGDAFNDFAVGLVGYRQGLAASEMNRVRELVFSTEGLGGRSSANRLEIEVGDAVVRRQNLHTDLVQEVLSNIDFPNSSQNVWDRLNEVARHVSEGHEQDSSRADRGDVCACCGKQVH